MAHASSRSGPTVSVGLLLQYWRKARNMSQLALAHEANVSPRHVCFLETGRAKPSRDMVLHLSDALTIPLRERNTLLLAAGFAPMFRESNLHDPQLVSVRAALDAILRQQEPYPAVVMNRVWDILMSNDGATRFFAALLSGRSVGGNANVIRLMFNPQGLRPCVSNWETVAHALIQRLHREAVGGVLDADTRGLLNEVLDYPDVPKRWHTPDIGATLLPVLPVSFRLGSNTFNFFSTVTVLGTPQDITLQELRIECFFPADSATRAAVHDLGRSR